MNAMCILNFYSERWDIEVFIRTNKMIFGLKGIQVRNYIAVKKFLLIQMIAYTYVASQDINYSFLRSLKKIRNNTNKNLIHYIYFLVKEENKTLDEVENAVLKAC
ncbi:MAG TPA: hypothetical protein VK426_05770, partial [Methanobacterium sp.]|nr:hypothetical protein [Methanobacterium sp.]